MFLKLVMAVMAALTLVYATTPHQYFLKDTFKGNDFFDSWQWQDADDPTHGRVNYVDKETAQNRNLSFASDNTFIMRADSSHVVSPKARGRDSVRIISDAAYGEAVIVLDLSHMPTGCGTWPAFWTLSQDGPWPNGGEIDIIEGVHNQTNNLASLHTTPGCMMEDPRRQIGNTVSLNCDTNFNFNQGCGTSFSQPDTYGAGLNSQGGGYYVMEKSASRGISIWYWQRDDPSLPAEIRYDTVPMVYPSPSWGLPEAQFPPDECNYNTYFNEHNIIFDLTFCGDWAGATFSAFGCGSSCDTFVDQHPEAFSEAYWEINSLRVYTLD